jgi:hypothetical protein
MAMNRTQDKYPLTVAQLRWISDELAAMKERAESISQLMTAGYGNTDQRAIRAGDIYGAIQRLQWELERAASKSASASA